MTDPPIFLFLFHTYIKQGTDNRTTLTHVRDMEAQYEQQDELHAATAVVVHRPGLEVFLGSLHPAGSLFECSVGADSARAAHADFVRGLRACGVGHVFALPDILAAAPRAELEALALEAVTYELHADADDVVDDVAARAEREQLSDAYKRAMLASKSAAELVTMVLTAPTVVLRRIRGGAASGNALAVERVALSPVSNLVFLRDQQIVTARGLVIGALKEPQRRRENALLRRTFELLGVPAVGHVTRNDAPGARVVATLEGGDYLAAPAGLAFLGVGLRTSDAAAAQLLGRGLVGVPRLAVVRDDGDRQQKRMHLDTVFNIVDERHCTVWEWAITHKNLQRVVALYECDHAGMPLVRDGRCPMCGAADPALRAAYAQLRCPRCARPYRDCACEFVPETADGDDDDACVGRLPERVGTYRLVRRAVELTQFLADEGYAVIPVTEEEQTDYMVNYLNLGRMPRADGTPGPVRLLSVHSGLAQKLRAAGVAAADVAVEDVDYRGITRMYGAAHCSSQVFRCPDPAHYAEYAALFDAAQKRIDAVHQQNTQLEKDLLC